MKRTGWASLMLISMLTMAACNDPEASSPEPESIGGPVGAVKDAREFADQQSDRANRLGEEQSDAGHP